MDTVTRDVESPLLTGFLLRRRDLVKNDAGHFCR